MAPQASQSVGVTSPPDFTSAKGSSSPVTISHKPVITTAAGGMVASTTGIALQAPAMVRPAAVTITGLPGQTSNVHMIATITKPTANKKVGELSNASNNAVLGAIFGTLGAIALVLLFVSLRRKKFMYGGKGKQSAAEQGRARHVKNPTTDHLINEAHRVRQERNRRNRERASQPSDSSATKIEMTNTREHPARG
ncbi:hypothetical protein EK21DRAFT_94247 [Setomelanomma holmii]|uniref:Uncharacterized protein n=1 Tax=Setomelanomma holmii TaxID=210430 RepID=A0A9P4GZ69_9PLEO|nr:hypothetical protein EK21DRAFT_94247 [Setomelanomma holmii]